jgi:hypothetical protein
LIFCIYPRHAEKNTQRLPTKSGSKQSTNSIQIACNVHETVC